MTRSQSKSKGFPSARVAAPGLEKRRLQNRFSLFFFFLFAKGDVRHIAKTYTEEWVYREKFMSALRNYMLNRSCEKVIDYFRVVLRKPYTHFIWKHVIKCLCCIISLFEEKKKKLKAGAAMRFTQKETGNVIAERVKYSKESSDDYVSCDSTFNFCF